jgi:hypothetical protein
MGHSAPGCAVRPDHGGLVHPNMVAIGCGDDPKLYNTVDMGQFAVRGFGFKPFCQNVLSALQSDCPS